MKNLRKIICILLVVCMFAAVFAACTPNQPAVTTPNTPDTPDTPDDPNNGGGTGDGTGNGNGTGTGNGDGNGVGEVASSYWGMSFYDGDCIAK